MGQRHKTRTKKSRHQAVGFHVCEGAARNIHILLYESSQSHIETLNMNNLPYIFNTKQENAREQPNLCRDRKVDFAGGNYGQISSF